MTPYKSPRTSFHKIVDKQMTKNTTMASIDKKIATARQRLAALRSERDNTQHRRTAELKQMRLRVYTSKAKLRKLGGCRADYLAAVQDESLPPYVVRNQAKLCQMVHRMQCDDELLKMAKRHSKDTIRHERRALSELRQQAPLREIPIINKITQEAKEVAELQTKIDGAVQRHREIMEAVAAKQALLEHLSKQLVVLSKSKGEPDNPALNVRKQMDTMPSWMDGWARYTPFSKTTKQPSINGRTIILEDAMPQRGTQAALVA